MNEFGIDAQKCIFVSDRGANVLAALVDYESINCIDHIINNIMEADEMHNYALFYALSCIFFFLMLIQLEL